ncbi:antitermination protein NusG [uncultured Methylobacterium sp.]|jgi:transcriptional antiterminator NusG|uniref:transcription termination/antitermination protein NusG n=1 Tax=uncultured Methylobacterium sp. TaxID=157278 RepID=UPI00260779FB|nr:antitermination protein NusG [uncultured Methylobacterium sp.]
MTAGTRKPRRIPRRRREALAAGLPTQTRGRSRRRRVQRPRATIAADRVWLVARLRPRWASRVAGAMAQDGIAVFDAREEIDRTVQGRRVRVAVPVLRGLVFLGLRDDGDLARAERHPGIERILYRDGRAVVIPPSALQLFADAVTGHGDEAGEEAVSAVLFALGETVRVAEGPLAERTGIVEAVDPARRRYRVAVEMFGRATAVLLDEDQIEPE